MKLKKLALSLLLAVCYFSLASPSTSIAIDNRSSCSLKLLQIYHDSNRTSLNLPADILPNSIESGEMAFSSSWSNTPQRVTGTYLLTCDHVQYVLTLTFYAGAGPNELGTPAGYWLQSSLDRPGAPVIISPRNKVSITDATPIVITIHDTEITYAQPQEATIINDDIVGDAESDDSGEHDSQPN